MQANKRLDLKGVVIPICFFVCKSTLAAMSPGDVLEVCLRDPDILNDLLTIIEHSGDKLMSLDETDEGYFLWIQKGDSQPAYPT